MKLFARIALAALGMAPVAALGDNSPKVIMATPGIGDGAIERFTIRFSQPMVPLGDPRATAPVAVECATGGEGRWVDQQTFVHDFTSPLPGGATCKFKLDEKLKSLAGYEVGGTREFTVDAGGPVARAVLPGRYGGDIEEDQVFLVAANLTPTPQSVAANAYCAVDGLGEKIAVEVLPADTAGKLLPQLKDNYAARNFLESAGLPADLPAAAADRQRALSNVVALKCRRPLPPGREMALIWSGQIAGAGGKLAGTDQRFDYTVRKPFTARFECSRVNPQAGCNPVETAHVRFTAPIALEQAKAIRIKTADGKELSPDDKAFEKNATTTSDVTFKGLPYATDATIVLPAGVKDESGRALANAERFPLAIRFDEAPPLVKFAAAFGIVESKAGATLPVTVRNIEPELQGRNLAVTGQRVRIADNDAAVAEWLRKVDKADDYDVETVGKGDDAVQINNTGSRAILSSGQGDALNVALPGKGKDFEVVGLPLGQPGFYVVELASPKLGRALLGRDAPRYVASAALVTNLAVHFKWGAESSLAWVTSLDTGKPVAGATVQVSDSCTGKLLARGTTDRSGGLMIRNGLPRPESYGSCDSNSSSHALMVSARAAGDFSFTLTSWGEGIRPYDFDLPYGYGARDDIFHTVFDRTLVRQGETVNMKHILRRESGAGFALAPGFTGTLRLSHSGSDTQFDLPLTIDANGIGETQWTAPAGAPMGDYNIRLVRIVDEEEKTLWTSQSFKVDEYKLPTMKASVAGPKEAAIKASSLPLDLFVGYLSGGGAANLPVDLRVSYTPRTSTPDGWDGYSFGGSPLTEGTKPLNGDGEEDQVPLPPAQTLPATLGGDGARRTTIEVPKLDANTNMLVEMDYEDANGETLTASRTVPLWSSAVQLGIKTDGWLMKQDDLRLRFVTLDTDGKPVAGRKIEVEIYSREVLTARRRLIGGFYAYDNQARTTRLSDTCSATTDKLGLAQCSLDPGVSGEVYVVATTIDDNGNVARAVRSVWLAGDDDWWFGGDNGDRMDVVAEQHEYKAGDTARFQVRMPFRSATALVTVEREGVLKSFTTELSGKDPVVEVKLDGNYAPDVFVSVMAVRGRIERGWGSWLGDLLRGWGFDVGDAQAREPTALVDLAKPAYRLGIAKIKVGWDAHRLDVAVKADRERYAARDIAQVDVQVKRPDGKPAASADVAFAAVDQALLQLSPNESWDVLTAVMGERPLSVLTATAQMQVVGKRHYGRKAVEAGGGGGGDLSGLNRENFQPVLLWRGRVALDANGRARIPVQLNDALSSFKLVAIATDGNQLYGTGMADVRTAQDLSIFAGLPPLVREGDWFAAGFTLRNGSAKPMTVTASVDVFPQVAAGKPLTVTIPAGGAAPVAWNLTAPQGVDNLRWRVVARTADGKATDQVTVMQDVAPAVPIEVWAATLAQVGPGSQIMIQPPAGALAGRGTVDIRLSDTLAPPLEGVRAWMAAYPYTCFEQRLSKAVATSDAGAWNALAGEMPTYQASDGLLRYFPSESLTGSEALSAYVLALTSEAGLTIPEGPRAKLIEGLKAVLDGRVRNESYGDVRLQKTAIFAALARAGAATPAMLGQIGLTPAEMPTGLLADHIAALDKVPGLANAPALKSQAEDVLRTRLVYEGTRVDLSDASNVPWWMMSSGDESAIKALVAVLGRPGWQDDAPKLMVGVASRQSRGRWDTTPANAWGAVAVRKFAGLYPATAITGSTNLSLGARSIAKGWPLAYDARAVSFALPAGPTPLRLAQTGGAGPWALVQVSAAVPLTRPLNAGYRLTRKVDVVQARVPGKLTRGDVVRVTLTVEASAERNWVVINDPVPGGATVLGNLGGQSQTLQQGGTSTGSQPSYVERGKDSWRAYFGWLPRGTHTVNYTMRLNAAGRFGMPPSRVEAMYAPAIRAQLPNQPVVVAQR